ncbi:hypothetical protein C789_2816 [Microcystis aeruginosa FACHB-905 = DIANCHI905]|nr:hypothetical protein C789_2816 [Microcystis aeruginosa FACHB-905 = DIANCHI905]
MLPNSSSLWQYLLRFKNLSSIISKILWFLAIISNPNSIVYLLILTYLCRKCLPVWISATFGRRYSH